MVFRHPRAFYSLFRAFAMNSGRDGIVVLSRGDFGVRVCYPTGICVSQHNVLGEDRGLWGDGARYTPLKISTWRYRCMYLFPSFPCHCIIITSLIACEYATRHPFPSRRLPSSVRPALLLPSCLTPYSESSESYFWKSKKIAESLLDAEASLG